MNINASFQQYHCVPVVVVHTVTYQLSVFSFSHAAGMPNLLLLTQKGRCTSVLLHSGSGRVYQFAKVVSYCATAMAGAEQPALVLGD